MPIRLGGWEVDTIVGHEQSGTVDTDRIEYSIQGFELKPQAIYLDINVQFFSHDLSRPLRKGLADRCC